MFKAANANAKNRVFPDFSRANSPLKSLYILDKDSAY